MNTFTRTNSVISSRLPIGMVEEPCARGNNPLFSAQDKLWLDYHQRNQKPKQLHSDSMR